MGEPQEKEEFFPRPPIDEDSFTLEQRVRLEIVLGWFEQMQTKHFSGFLPALAETGCQLTRAEEGAPYLAAFTSYDRTGGYLNRIGMTPQSLEQERRLFGALAHEGVHALQNKHCAAMHALPHNLRTGIMLCPRDYIYLKELCERDAYAKEALANLGLEAWRRKTGLEATPWSEVPGNAVRLALIVQDSNVPHGLAVVGEEILQRRALIPDDAVTEEEEDIRAEDKTISHKDRYNRQSLFDYLYILTDRKDELEQGRLVFTRLEPEDIIALGAAFGPNPFTDENGALRPGLETPSPLHPDSAEILRELNEALGIEDEADLPTFGQALVDKGIDRESFLWAARLPPLQPAEPQNPVKPLAPGPKPA